MNKLIAFLHNPKAKTLRLGRDDFRAERYPTGEVCVWYRNCMLCRLTPDGLQWTVYTYPLSGLADCNRLTEIFALLGMPQLRVRWSVTSEHIQRVHNGLVVAESRLPLKQPLRVTV